MTTPIVRRTTNKSIRSQEPGKPKMLPLMTRRAAAVVTEIALVTVSGLVPFGIGVLANSRTDVERVPLNPVLSLVEREVARPLALPINYGTRNVTWLTNFFWSVGALASLSLTGWQIYLLAKTGSTLPKRWFGVRVVTNGGTPPGLLAVVIREGVGRWALPLSVTYLLWRYSPFFPNLGVFTGLMAVLMLAESMGFPRWRDSKRALHDRIAGTYTIDATKPFSVASLRAGKPQPDQWNEYEEEAAIADVVISPLGDRRRQVWEWMQQNPSLTLFLVALVSMVGVLGTLIGTQVYIQSQENQRTTEQGNRQQFQELEQRLQATATTNLAERQQAIMAMGTLKYPPATKYLVDLLLQETNPVLRSTIQQSLVNIGIEAIPELKRKNQLLTNDLATNNPAKAQQLQANQQAINQILLVNRGKLHNVDLSQTNLSQPNTSTNPNTSFNLVLERIDLWGVNFKGAQLNQANFQGSRFRGPGNDGRYDTYDDWITDLSQAELKQANFQEANLSRVLLNKSDLSRANLKKANLASARLIGANLSSAQLVGADLRNAVLENASLTGADLGEAKLNEAELFGARLGRAIAIGAFLSHANLTKTDWLGADLSGAYLDHTNLSSANLSATRLTGAVLRGANLSNANLSNADLSLADLQRTNLRGADFQGAILAPGNQNPTEQFVETPQTGAKSALVKGVDFSEVKNLDKRQIAYICTQGGIHPSCP